ncbi:hypothetical protein [Grimontia hollisae]|uniref:hypothetical protein n=1 Tax=Grimontia hollisae TaxID=673 RepID=UPI00165E61D0|nr:hypothetical protein [Grimontia hollisae]
MTSNPSISQLEALAAIDSHFKGLIARKTVTNYDEFVSQLNSDIESGISGLQHNRHQFQHPHWGEDPITCNLITHLNALGYDAEHDTQHGGHCDILVKNPLQRFEWIGEAKLWKGPDYIRGGLEQLLTRYASGTINENRGGVLVYVKQPNALKKLQTWKSVLTSLDNTISVSDDQHNPLRMDSNHLHLGSGQNYSIRHFFVALNHATSTEPEYD